MLYLINSLSKFTKGPNNNAHIDGLVFRLHYRVTSSLLLLCCLVLTAFTITDFPMHCTAIAEVSDKVLNTFCWSTSTFTLPKYLHTKTGYGTNSVAPGIGTFNPDTDKSVHHAYYQWVPFMLLLQGILFYFPHWIWKNWEGGHLQRMTDGLRGGSMNKLDRKAALSQLAEFLSGSLHMHNLYAIKYLICQICNFGNAVGNIYFLNAFFRGVFLDFGTQVLTFTQLEQENRTDPMVVVFPRVTICKYLIASLSGPIETRFSQCVLYLNVLNEKIFIFFWFWLVFLAVISAISLLQTIILFIVPPIRVVTLRFLCRSPLGVIRSLCHRLKFGDFFLLTMLEHNIDTLSFREVLTKMAEQLDLTREKAFTPRNGNEGMDSKDKCPQAY